MEDSLWAQPECPLPYQYGEDHTVHDRLQQTILKAYQGQSVLTKSW